tara:strand:+ start:275 stop:427 length:153 start_codon:yes stop_codon:yes gene_type:complete
MLFAFGGWWKYIVGLCLSWGLFVLLGFEFTIVTLLSLIFITQIKDFSFHL